MACNLSYPEILLELGLPTLLYWHIRYDMIQLFRLLHHHIRLTTLRVVWVLLGTNQTGGHSQKLEKPRCRSVLRKHSFFHRVVDQWNASCAIWCLEIKAFFDYKILHDGWKTIATKGDLDNINNQVFKLPRLANYDLHKNLTYSLTLNFMTKCQSEIKIWQTGQII